MQRASLETLFEWTRKALALQSQESERSVKQPRLSAGMTDESLQSHYSIVNFARILKPILERDSHLLEASDISHLNKLCNELSPSAQILYLRLFGRKPVWFRVHGLMNKGRRPSVLEREEEEILVSSQAVSGNSGASSQSFTTQQSIVSDGRKSPRSSVSQTMDGGNLLGKLIQEETEENGSPETDAQVIAEGINISMSLDQLTQHGMVHTISKENMPLSWGEMQWNILLQTFSVSLLNEVWKLHKKKHTMSRLSKDHSPKRCPNKKADYVAWACKLIQVEQERGIFRYLKNEYLIVCQNIMRYPVKYLVPHKSNDC
jgi:hypothetical protein